LTFSCPTPLVPAGRIVLGHGSGGKLSAALMREVFLPAFGNPVLNLLNDQAVVERPPGRLAITTDSFVVKPLFFPGGDIGSLAIHGTVNDLAVGGARPLYISVAFILEEGFEIAALRRIADSMAAAARACGVLIVTGDTKVVDRGKGDGVFINTTGIGAAPEGLELSAGGARPGDKVVLSGYIGDHGIAILSSREGLEFESRVESDSAPLHTLVETMLAATGRIRVMRDPTRGGVSSALNEIAAQSQVGMEIEESAIPVRPAVRGACEMLGLDPLYVANEGKLIAIVAPEDAEKLVAAMRSHPLGQEARIIGTVTSAHPGMVVERTAYGTTRVVDMLAGDQLPRIC